MKRYRVYVSGEWDEILEFPDDTPQDKIESECKDCWGVLISNIDSGWYELEDGKDE